VVQGQLEERAEAAQRQREGLEVEVRSCKDQLQQLQLQLGARNAELAAAARANKGLKREVCCLAPPACRIHSPERAPCGCHMLHCPPLAPTRLSIRSRGST
jgi:Tfp pilus assembly protein FimV